MKSTIPSTTFRLVKAPQGLLLAGLLLLLPACSLDRRVLPPPHHVYVVGAMVRTSAGVVPIAGDDLLFAGATTPPVFATDDGLLPGLTPRERILGQWRSYLRRRLNDASASPEFRARFGLGDPAIPGGFCLLAAEVRRTESVATVPPDPETGPELGDCGGSTAAPIACATAPGTAPRLELSMPLIEFGYQPVGVLSAATPIVVSNGGTGRLCLAASALDASLSSDPGDFTPLDGADCLPRSSAELRAGATFLEPGTARPSCTLRLRFLPRQGGPRSAVLRVSASDPDQPVAYVPVRGEGQPGTLRPSAASFCPMTPVAVPGVGDCFQDVFSLTNDGPGVVTVTSVASPTAAVDWLLSDFMPTRPPPDVILARGAPISFVARVCNAGPNTMVMIASNAGEGVRSVPLTSGCRP